MRTPQLRQRPRRRSQERTGTLSYGAMATPHDGQDEPGLTSDSPRGSRWMTTLRKRPRIAPATAEKMISRAEDIGDAKANRGYGRGARNDRGRAVWPALENFGRT